VNQPSPDVENIEELKSRIRELEEREMELERKLQVNQSLHSMILDSLPINVFLEDPEGRTIFANKQACQLNGMKLKDLAGKTVYDFFPKPIADLNRKVDLEVWKNRSLITREIKVGFQGRESHMFTGKTIIELPEFDKEYLLGFGLDITDLKKAQEKIAQMAYYDALTGLPNRWFVQSYLEKFQHEIEMDDPLLGVLLLDLDHFKIVNDSLGHHAGDLLLQCVAERLRSTQGEEQVIARLGGDEFIFLLPGLGNPEEAALVSEHILSVLDEPFTVHGQSFKITPSIGISLYPSHAEDIYTLFQNADIAMYQSKEEGRGCYTFFTPDLKHSALKRMNTISAAP
jgi:diguanylate cyclase (GGDEF)-like protein/PAS domain S-box-containing protein